MLSKVISGTNVGLNSVPVTVEVDIASQGLPSFTIVGLADRAVEESKERVRAALRNSGADFPVKKITVNLAPADIRKIGPSFDLPIAAGIMSGSGQLPSIPQDALFIGELSLDGSLKPVSGVLSLTLLAKKSGYKKIFLPSDNAVEASVVDGIEIYPFENLSQLAAYLLGGETSISPFKKSLEKLFEDENYEYDFSQVKGQEQAKRALEIAAAGGHNVLMKGPPGSGKTLLARTFPSILPPLSLEEALEVTQIYSVSGNLTKDKPLITKRPFRGPHHSASHFGLIGGGNLLKPGEVTFAHRGVLFLDEMPEFPRTVLESLRQPMEDREVEVTRVSGSVKYPAQFILIGALNPCPCGFLGDSKKTCVCAPSRVASYQKKISGPLLDRIDIHLEVPAVDVEKLSSENINENSRTIRARVIQARSVQSKRFKNEKNLFVNSEMTNLMIKKYCVLNPAATDLLKMAILKMSLSARSYHRILKLSRTIADLEGSEQILAEHVAESLQYRSIEDNI